MTEPLTPLQRVLRVTNRGDRALDALLRDAAADASARIRRLGASDSISSKVRAAQLTLVRAELLRTSGALWGNVGLELRKQIEDASVAAAEAASYLDRVVWDAVGGAGAPEALAQAHRAAALDTARQYEARTANNIALSEQVYHTQQLADGFVDGEINRALLLGESWKELADRVRDSIRPGVRGGVAYAAKRLGRTEINNAFHRSTIDRHKDLPWVNGMRWNLSRSHPKADTCDEYANEEHFRGGAPGVYRKTDVPRKPHPQCFCFLTAEAMDEDEFVAGFLRGDFDNYLDDRLGPATADRIHERVAAKPTPAVRRSKVAVRKPSTPTPEVKIPTTTIRPTPAPKPKPTPSGLLARYDKGKGVVERQNLTGGVTAKVELLTFKDGTRAVLKQGRNAQEAASEVAYSRVARAVGVKTPETVRVSGRTILMDYVEDTRNVELFGMDQYGFQTAKNDAVRAIQQSEAGQHLGLLDTVFQHNDRHNLNWLLDADGNPVAIDNAFFDINTLNNPGSPFADAADLYNGGRYALTEWKDHTFSPNDINKVRAAVREVESELREIKVGKQEKIKRRSQGRPEGDGFDVVMERLDALAEHAKGTVDRL